jgi:hypothetical protein
MGNQSKKLALNSFQAYSYRFRGLISAKRKNYRMHQLETMKIMSRILEIKKKRPELSKYLDEMPEFPQNVNDSEIRLADLRKYHNDLLELLEKYELEAKKRFWFI